MRGEYNRLPYICGLTKPHLMDSNLPRHPFEGNRIFRDQLVTIGDLEDFKNELLDGIKAMLLSHSPQGSKKWLKSYEVMKLLGISKGSLQTFRNNGTLPYTTIGRQTYYDLEEINKMLLSKKRAPVSKSR